MKSFITIILLLIFGTNFCKGQDSTVLFVPGMFDKDIEQMFISPVDGWLFKEGNDTNWAKKDLDITGWKKLKPTDLSAKYANKDGKVECWFRIKIKLGTAFENKPLGFKISTWAATDFYIDGNLIASFGNTGQNGTPYREHRPYGELPVPVNLKSGNEYTLALHFVDYLSPFPPHQLKSEEMGLRNLIRLTGPKYYSDALNGTKEGIAYSTIWISVCTVLSLLFWLLSIQNRSEKNLRLIALGSTLITLGILCSTLTRYTTGLSYVGHMLYGLAVDFFWTLLLTIVPLILANIFKRKVSRILKIYLILVFIAFIINIFFDLGIIKPINYFVLITVCIYYAVSSWKTLRGAQWAIVAGLMFTLFMITLFIFMSIKYNSDSFPNVLLYVTGFALPFPLSLVVYVSMRFKEIIKEVQQNAHQVLRLSEEKKEQAINQQKILQEEVNKQTAELRSTLENLKSTQSQLIQSEKMASLGELTAGIAHEIQNPLNFVNNFSEVNSELITEMKQEIDKGDFSEVKTIANNIDENEQKIIFHGRRADAIVKGMLQHARSSTGLKEPTDVNALADEHFRLSYHGLRAKDRDFNASMSTDYDKSIGKINIIPQDIGRVLLNLYNNAFYAVNEKKKQYTTGYEPTVSVSTSRINDKVEIRVKDNGNGVPQQVVGKIFHPFFTTKPTGQGTGLGLSLSYDIVKAHGGEIKVNSKEGEGAEFIIHIPVS